MDGASEQTPGVHVKNNLKFCILLFLGVRGAKWGIWIVFMDYRLFHMDSMDLPSNQQTTIRDYLKPGFIVVFAIIVIIILVSFLQRP